MCLLTWIEADPSPGQQHLGVFVLCNEVEKDFIGENIAEFGDIEC